MFTSGVPLFLDAPEAEVAARRAATRLRNVLRLNSGFSFVTGVVTLAAAGPIADLLDVDQVWPIRALGAGLVGFAVAVLAVAGARTSRLRRWSQLVSLADLGWVVGTVLALGWLSAAGAILMGAIALVVLDLAIFQLRARRRLIDGLSATAATLDESPPVEVIEFSRPSSHRVEELWPVMTDHALYAELALNLKAAEALTPNGPGFRRSCTDSVGRTWSETCTLWDPGRRFDVNVDISEYPYPLQTVQGSWRVDPAERTASTITMTFAIQPEPGLAGRLFLPFMQSFFRPILARIARGWEHAASQRPAAETVGR